MKKLEIQIVEFMNMLTRSSEMIYETNALYLYKICIVIHHILFAKLLLYYILFNIHIHCSPSSQSLHATLVYWLRALSSLRGLRGAPEVPPLCRETQSFGQQMLNATVGINGLTIFEIEFSVCMYMNEKYIYTRFLFPQVLIINC